MLVASNTRLSVGGHCIAAMAMVWSLIDTVPGQALLIWSGALIFVLVLRGYLSWQFNRRVLTDAAARRWVHEYAVILLLTGIVWGSASWMAALHATFLEQLFIATLLLGLTAAAITTLAPVFICFIAFFSGMVLLQTVAFALSGEKLGLIMALLTPIFFLIFLSAARALATSLTRTLELTRTVTQASRAKTEFLSRMSHELRTPLNSIIGFSQLLTIDQSLQPQQKQNARDIYKSGTYLLQLINEILDLTKIEEGNIDLCLESIIVADMMLECTSMIAAQAKERKLELEIGELNPGARIYADYTRLKEAILNLLSNAVKYNCKEGKIRLSFGEGDSGYSRISVSDTGSGIEAARIHELFQPFNRLGVDRYAVEGTGIGLAITKRLVATMGGNVGVDSTPGVGSTFWIDLPKHSEAA